MPIPGIPMCIFTIGYEKADVFSVIETLKNSGVHCVADVRRFPVSRKEGFSKRAFMENLHNAEIAYLPARELGAPREVLERYRHDGDWEKYRRDYLSYLNSQRASLEKLLAFSIEKPTALFCFERDAARCHRLLIANELKMLCESKNTGIIQIKNLYV